MVRVGCRPGAGYVSDFDQLWHAARTALSGGDPSAAPPVGTQSPGFPPPMALYYPLTAVVIASPLAALSRGSSPESLTLGSPRR
jgi:hypothetical protein